MGRNTFEDLEMLCWDRGLTLYAIHHPKQDYRCLHVTTRDRSFNLQLSGGRLDITASQDGLIDTLIDAITEHFGAAGRRVVEQICEEEEEELDFL